MTIRERTAVVKQAALDAGFDAVGIARAVPFVDEYAQYEEWIRRQYHGTMAYMERNAEKRRDITQIVEGAQSVIVVAQNYYTPHQHDADEGKISRYAWGDDYHDVIPAKLDAVIATISTMDPHATSKRYTDTGPVLEKQWAVRAGVGWQGKHSNILRRDIGSWFFLGVIITTMDLLADDPMPDHCGTCTACIDACPTSAIVEPMVVDGTKCLSYWTIETPAAVPIPGSISEHLDGWIFGCDVCQDVCPWNRFQRPTTEPRFEPRSNGTVLKPDDVLFLSPEEFRSRFRGSPLTRPKHAGLQRNAQALRTRQGHDHDNDAQ